jgi:hypothetical protein
MRLAQDGASSGLRLSFHTLLPSKAEQKQKTSKPMIDLKNEKKKKRNLIYFGCRIVPSFLSFKYASYVFCNPASRVTFAFQPSLESRETSSNFLGVPSGLLQFSC